MAKTIFVTLCLLAVVLSARIIQSDATSHAPELEIPAEETVPEAAIPDDSIAGVRSSCRGCACIILITSVSYLYPI